MLRAGGSREQGLHRARPPQTAQEGQARHTRPRGLRGPAGKGRRLQAGTLRRPRDGAQGRAQPARTAGPGAVPARHRYPFPRRLDPLPRPGHRQIERHEGLHHHHGGLQQAVHLLHRAHDAGSRNLQAHVGDRGRGPPGRGRRLQGSGTAGAERELLEMRRASVPGPPRSRQRHSGPPAPPFHHQPSPPLPPGGRGPHGRAGQHLQLPAPARAGWLGPDSQGHEAPVRQGLVPGPHRRHKGAGSRYRLLHRRHRRVPRRVRGGFPGNARRRAPGGVRHRFFLPVLPPAGHAGRRNGSRARSGRARKTPAPA